MFKRKSQNCFKETWPRKENAKKSIKYYLLIFTLTKWPPWITLRCVLWDHFNFQMSFKQHKLADNCSLCMTEASCTLKAHEKIPIIYILADIFCLLFNKMQVEFMLKPKTSSNLRWKKLNITHCHEKYTMLQTKMTKWVYLKYWAFTTFHTAID